MAAGPRPGGRQLIESLSLPRVVLARHLQMPLVLVYRELGQQGAEGSLRIADETQIDLGPPAELLTPHIDLDDRRLLGKELLVREVRTDHQEEIAGHHSVVAGRESEETRHAHVE